MKVGEKHISVPRVSHSRRDSCLSIEKLMTKEVITLTVADNLGKAMECFRQHSIRHIPILSHHNQLYGILSKRDVIMLKGGGDSERLSDRQIGSIIEKRIVAVKKDTCTRIAAQKMFLEKIGCLPIIDSSRQLLGLVTESDFIAAYAHQVQCDCKEDLEQE
jgi:acetoin utilization protein AcuB